MQNKLFSLLLKNLIKLLVILKIKIIGLEKIINRLLNYIWRSLEFFVSRLFLENIKAFIPLCIFLFF